MTQREQDGTRTDPSDSKKSKGEIESAISETRSAIGEDIKALGEKLSPEQLREGAKTLMHDAKEEAKDLLREVKTEAAESLRGIKDDAVESLRSAKESAVETVTEVVDEVGERARRVGTETASFLTANAVPLALIGMGVGWIALTQNRRPLRTLSSGAQRGSLRSAPTMRGGAKSSSNDRGDSQWGEREASLGTRASSAVRSATERARETVDEIEERTSAMTHSAIEAGSELAGDIEQTLRRANERAMSYAEENPIALGALVAAAGVGVGLLLPLTQMETELAAKSGLVDETRRTVERVGQTAKSAARDISAVITEGL